MFARNVSLRLKPNTLSEFTRTFDKDVIPMLRNTKEHAEAYNSAGYPQVLKTLDRVLDGAPKVQVAEVIYSTIHKTATTVAA